MANRFSKGRSRRLRLVGDNDGQIRLNGALWILGWALATLGLGALLPKRLFGAAVGGCAAFAAFRFLTVDPAIDTDSLPNNHADPQMSGHLFINDTPHDVYEIARHWEHFSQFSADAEAKEAAYPQGAKLIVSRPTGTWELDASIIADQPDEFFAFRLEYKGQVSGTCLITFDTAPGAIGTVVKVVCRHKVSASGVGKEMVVPVVTDEIDKYLLRLGTLCEARHSAEPVT